MKLKAKNKEYEIRWVSINVSPGELWINMDYAGRIPDIVGEFDGVEKFEVDSGLKKDGKPVFEVYNGYKRLTHVIQDDTLTLRIRKGE